jgi:N-methylhydantoinase A
MSKGQLTFAIDTGGTFTDLVVSAEPELRLFKSLTTPDDPVDGVLDVLRVAARDLGLPLEDLLARGELLVHGTTRAINALVTRTTARTAFLTSEGHPDILLFREGGRLEPFNFATPYPEPLVPRALTHEIPGRIAADGRVVRELDEPAVIATLGRLRDMEVEAVAVTLLWSIVNPEHELRVGLLIEEHLPGVPYTLSHQLNPTLREYRRASSTCIDASLKPLMTDYFSSLERRLEDAGFRGRLLIATSQGGMLDAGEVARSPIHSINSGPSMAPVAGRHYAHSEMGSDTVIIADTGGTTFDVSLVRDGHIPRTRETWIGPVHQGHITGFPSVDVTSVGAGGGSIAWIDDGGLLHVGPHSAGSQPGPACYGHGGTAPTLTDACLVLGYLDPAFFLGGAMALDVSAAENAIRGSIGSPLGLSLEEAAAAIVRIATENMVHAIEEVTVHQGIDAREAVLVGGGGAAGLNLVAIAARLGCRRVLIPETGAALSAAGALLSDLSSDAALTHVTTTAAFDFDGVAAVLERLRARCGAFLEDAPAGAATSIEYAVEARYPRQNWEIEVPLRSVELRTSADVAALADAFHEAHRQVFAINEPDSEIEIVTWRARARCDLHGSGQRRVARRPADAGLEHERRIWVTRGGWTDAKVLDFDALQDGERFSGPAIVESSFTTVVVEPGATACRSTAGHLTIDVEAAG